MIEAHLEEAPAPVVEWSDYAHRQPETAGVYQWRVPSRAVAGLIVTFYAHMRMRGAGYQQVLSPLFDYWDGYRLHVPAGTQWRISTSAPDCKEYDAVGIEPESIEVAKCPFCGVRPKWKGIEKSHHGILIGAKPHELNTWWLECCVWARTPHMKDPRELSAKRSALLCQSSPPQEVETK